MTAVTIGLRAAAARRPIWRPVAGPVLVAVLALTACGQPSPAAVRAASIAQCERKFGPLAPVPAKGAALCSCMTDTLADSGLAITDMLGADRPKVEAITRSCAASAGVPLPQ